MKKLLFFILVLFGSLSMTGLASGCNAQICTCSNGSWVTFGQYCPVVYNNYSTPDSDKVFGAIAFDPVTGNSGFAQEQYTSDNAKSKALKACNSANCTILGTFRAGSCGALAYSKTDGKYAYVGRSQSGRKKLNQKAKEKCEKNGGSNCKIIISTCAFDSYRGYDNVGTYTGPVYPKE